VSVGFVCVCVYEVGVFGGLWVCRRVCVCVCVQGVCFLRVLWGVSWGFVCVYVCVYRV
jgi:hypothetical protein